MSPLPGLFARRAELLKELAATEAALAEAFAAKAEPEAADEVIGLEEAAALMGEPPSTFRRRPEYLKAKVSREGERRLRYSRAALERIRADRLDARLRS
jgi:hypothetical protein